MSPRTGLLRPWLFALTLTLAIPASAAAAESPSGKDIQMVAPALDKYTQERLLGDVWQRPGLAPRDRSLVTISVLVANGQVAQLSGHIPIGMNNGLTQPEIAEAMTHLAFYVGWPNVFSAMPIAKEVFEKRAR